MDTIQERNKLLNILKLMTTKFTKSSYGTITGLVKFSPNPGYLLLEAAASGKYISYRLDGDEFIDEEPFYTEVDKLVDMLKLSTEDTVRLRYPIQGYLQAILGKSKCRLVSTSNNEYSASSYSFTRPSINTENFPFVSFKPEVILELVKAIKVGSVSTTTRDAFENAIIVTHKDSDCNKLLIATTDKRNMCVISMPIETDQEIDLGIDLQSIKMLSSFVLNKEDEITFTLTSSHFIVSTSKIYAILQCGLSWWATGKALITEKQEESMQINTEPFANLFKLAKLSKSSIFSPPCVMEIDAGNLMLKYKSSETSFNISSICSGDTTFVDASSVSIDSLHLLASMVKSLKVDNFNIVPSSNRLRFDFDTNFGKIMFLSMKYADSEPETEEEDDV